jgi:DNA-binding phage protein
MQILDRVKRVIRSDVKRGTSLLKISQKTGAGYATIWRLANNDDDHSPNLSTINKILTAYGKRAA